MTKRRARGNRERLEPPTHTKDTRGPAWDTRACECARTAAGSFSFRRARAATAAPWAVRFARRAPKTRHRTSLESEPAAGRSVSSLAVDRFRVVRHRWHTRIGT